MLSYDCIQISSIHNHGLDQLLPLCCWSPTHPGYKRRSFHKFYLLLFFLTSKQGIPIQSKEPQLGLHFYSPTFFAFAPFVVNFRPLSGLEPTMSAHYVYIPLRRGFRITGWLLFLTVFLLTTITTLMANGLGIRVPCPFLS